MAGNALRESYWSADSSRNILDISIGNALVNAAAAVPERFAMIEVPVINGISCRGYGKGSALDLQ